MRGGDVQDGHNVVELDKVLVVFLRLHSNSCKTHYQQN